jgi:calcineurin-like phosphoesterase family protein
MPNIFVISDTHFGHANILNFKRSDGSPVREFKDVDHMDEHMIERWNSVVRPQDKIYHLGDVAMRREKVALLARCNGHKRLIKGNHDTYVLKTYTQFFDEIYSYRVLDNIIFSHIPIHPESLGRFGANVHGHIHANQSPAGAYYNVSVEAVDYTPVSLEDLKKRLINEDRLHQRHARHSLPGDSRS